MEEYYITQTEFAESLGISLRTLERREIEINYILPKGRLSLEVREGFMKKLREWEQKKADNCQK